VNRSFVPAGAFFFAFFLAAALVAVAAFATRNVRGAKLRALTTGRVTSALGGTTTGGAVACPPSATARPPPAPLSLSTSEAVRAPGAPGANRTVIPQVPPTTIRRPVQPSATFVTSPASGPATVAERTARKPLPVLVSVTVRSVGAPPTCAVPRSAAAGAAMPPALPFSRTPTLSFVASL